MLLIKILIDNLLHNNLVNNVIKVSGVQLTVNISLLNPLAGGYNHFTKL